MRCRRFGFLCFALAILTFAGGGASAKDVYVAPWGIDGPPNTGLSIADPFRTISWSLNGASGLPLVAGDRILVLPGVYDIAAGEFFPIQLPVGVSLIGVGGATSTAIVSPGPDAVQVFGANGPNTMVTGFTVKGASGFPSGGIRVEGGVGYFWPTSPPLPPPPPGPGVASPTIADNVATGNDFGIWAGGSFGPTAARIHDTVGYANFFGDTETFGYFYPVYPIFDNNQTAYSFVGNYVNGAIAPASPMFRSNSMVGHYGAQVLLSGTFNYSFNSTSVGSFFGQYAGGIPFQAVFNSIHYYNTYDFFPPVPPGFIGFTDAYPLQPGPGNIVALPFLGGPSGLALTAASPCIDQGTNALFIHPPTGESGISSYDVYGNARIVNVPGVINAYYGTDVAQIDMGADEYNDGPDCLGGTVNTGGPCGGATGTGPVDTVFVNGSSGGNGRTVVVSTGDVIGVSLTLPPAGAPFPTKYIVNGWAGAPAGVGGTPWPKSVGSGCFPIFPATFVANTAKPSFSPSTPEATLCTQPCVVLDIPPGLPIGSVWTFQGITTDNGGPGSAAGGAICAAVTNGVITVVGP